jgi:hypothetical protein
LNEDTNRERFAGALRESYERFKANSDVLAAEYRRREAAGELQLEALNDL